MSFANVCTAGLGLLLLVGCHEDLPVYAPNQTPIAHALVAGMTASSVSFEYDGKPVQVTLDGSTSTDADGTIKTYRWLSGTPATATGASGAGGSSGASGEGGAGGSSGAGGASAGASAPTAGGSPTAGSSAAGVADGTGRWVPSGESVDWPPDEAMTTVTLGEGVWSFVLWVIDNKGAVSDPSTITITITPPLDPMTKTCVDSAYPNATLSCVTCVCGVSDTCRAAANQSVCGADCWGLINCLGANCPGFMPGGDTSCLVGKCSAFLAMTATSGATMIAPCLTPCATQCTAM